MPVAIPGAIGWISTWPSKDSTVGRVSSLRKIEGIRSYNYEYSFPHQTPTIIVAGKGYI